MANGSMKEGYGLQSTGSILIFSRPEEKGRKEATNVPHLSVKTGKTRRIPVARKFAHTISRSLGSVSTAVCRLGLTFFESEID